MEKVNKKLFVSIIISIVLLAGCSPASTQSPVFTEIPPVNGVEPTATIEGIPPGQTQVTQEQSSQTEQGSNGLFMGIHIDDIASIEQVSLVQDLGQLWTRFDEIYWDSIEPKRVEPPEYHWEVVNETALQSLGQSGLKVIGIVQFTPEWAQKFPPSACGAISEGELERFALFLKELVGRYSQPPYNVHYWELGNEPDVDRNAVDAHSGFGCWGDANDDFFGGGYYAEMLKAVYPQIKSADPMAQVLIGGLLIDCDPINPPETQPGSGIPKDCSPAKFLEGVLQVGGGDFFDGISFHSYDYYANEQGKFSNGNWHSSWDTTGPVVIAKARYLKDLLSRYGYVDKYLLNTELALICGRTGKEPECQTNEYTTTKANYLAEANAAALSEGLHANVWYSLTGWRGSGLANRSLKPNLAYRAFQFSIQVLEGSSFNREITEFPFIKGYEFEKDGKKFWILWALDLDSHELNLSGTPAAVHDVRGKELSVGQEVIITNVPVYIEWAP